MLPKTRAFLAAAQAQRVSRTDHQPVEEWKALLKRTGHVPGALELT